MKTVWRFAPFPKNLNWITAVILMASAARGADVSFYSLYKTEKFNQLDSGPPTAGGNNPFRIGASVGPAAAGSVTGVTVTGGNLGTIPLPSNSDGTFGGDLKFPSLAMLDAAAPAGNYLLTVNTLHDGQRTVTLTLPAETLASFPQAPHVSNWTAAQAINSGAAFTLTWDPFGGGTSSDFILVQIGDQITGNVYFESGLPGQPGSLNGTSTSVVIPAGKLNPSTSYSVEIGFYKFVSSNTTGYPGAVGVVGFTSRTDLNISTLTQGADVSFYALYKSEKFNQLDTGPSTAGGNNPFRIGASVGPATFGSVTGATVSGGNLGTIPLPSNSDGTFGGDLKYPSLVALDGAAAAGNYLLTVDTLHDGQRTLTLTLPAETLASFPQAPHVSNWTAAQSINSGAAFTLSWDTFVGGTINDFILVQIADQTTGNIYFESGLPGQPGSLNGTSTSVVIPAGKLSPSTTYLVELGFYKFVSSNTTGYPGAVGVVGFTSRTDLNITTAGASPIQFTFLFRHIAKGGSFLNNDTNATPQFPASIAGYRAQLVANNGANFPSPAQVLFTGPTGSGLNGTPSDPTSFSSSSSNAFYFSPFVTQPPTAPGGGWSVSYQGNQQNFTMPDPQASSRLVVPVPQLGVVNDIVKQVAWSFYDPSGKALSGTPPVVMAVRLQALDASDTVLYDSGFFSPTSLSYTLTSSLNWLKVGTIRLLYKDNLNNVYLVHFPKVTSSTPIELQIIGFPATNGFQFLLTGEAGRGYLVQFSPDLANWTDLVTTNLPSATVQLLDNQATNFASRFYRAKLAN